MAQTARARRFGFALLTALATSAVPARAETVLSLRESATLMVAPDELAATLRAEAASTSAADAQKRVNALIRDAVARAQQVAGTSVTTGGYNVWRIGLTPQDRTERWQASQSLMLSARDGAALLGLTGELQQKGLLVGSLAWRLSRDTAEKSQKEATRQALRQLRGRADEAAAILDLKFDSFRAIQLDGVDPIPPPRPMALMRGAEAAPPPTAVAEDIAVSASARADVVLTPR